MGCCDLVDQESALVYIEVSLLRQEKFGNFFE